MGRLSPGEEVLLGVFLRHLHKRLPSGSIASVRVFGSRARGQSDENSDLDVAVELAPGIESALHRAQGVDAAFDAMDETGLHGLALSAIVIPTIPAEATGLAANIAREGLIIWPRP